MIYKSIKLQQNTQKCSPFLCVCVCVCVCARVRALKMLNKLRKSTKNISVAIARRVSEINPSRARVRCCVTSPNDSLCDLELRVPYVHANSHQTSTPHKISSILIDVLQLIRWIRSSAQWCTWFIQFCASCSNAPRVCTRSNKTNMVDIGLLTDCKYGSEAFSGNSMQDRRRLKRNTCTGSQFEFKSKTYIFRLRHHHHDHNQQHYLLLLFSFSLFSLHGLVNIPIWASVLCLLQERFLYLLALVNWLMTERLVLISVTNFLQIF